LLLSNINNINYCCSILFEHRSGVGESTINKSTKFPHSCSNCLKNHDFSYGYQYIKKFNFLKWITQRLLKSTWATQASLNGFSRCNGTIPYLNWLMSFCVLVFMLTIVTISKLLLETKPFSSILNFLLNVLDL
jgi:hypothetical protein